MLRQQKKIFTLLVFMTLIQCQTQQQTARSTIRSNDFNLSDLDTPDWEEINHLAFLSKLSYLDPQDIEESIKMSGVANFRYLNEKGTQAYLFDYGTTIVIVFRGTETNWQDYSTDMNIWHQTMNGIRGHAGFMKAYHWVADQIDLYIEALPTSSRRVTNKKSVILTGHSLGGALAQIGAFELADKKNISIKKVVTFGAPRVFNLSSTTAYNTKLKDRTFNLIYNQDFVAGLPHWSLNFKRAGSAIYFTEGDCALSLKPIKIKDIVKRKFNQDIEFLRGLKFLQKPVKPLFGSPLPVKDHALQNYINCTAIYAGVKKNEQ